MTHHKRKVQDAVRCTDEVKGRGGSNKDGSQGDEIDKVGYLAASGRQRRMMRSGGHKTCQCEINEEIMDV